MFKVKFLLPFFVFHSLSCTLNPSSYSNEDFLIGSGEILDAAYSPDGQYLATLGSLGLLIRDAESLEVQSQHSSFTNMNEMKWSPDSHKLFVTNTNNNHSGFIIGIISNSTTEIPSTLDWSFLPLGYDELLIPIHNNCISFSSDANKLIAVTTNNHIEVYHTSSGELETIIDNVEDDISAAGFINMYNEIWYITNVSNGFNRTVTNSLMKYDVETEENELLVQLTTSTIGSAASFFGVTDDFGFILESDNISTSIGFLNSNINAIDLISKGAFEIVNEGSLFRNEGVKFFTNRLHYNLNNNSFVTLSPSHITYSVIVTSNFINKTMKRNYIFNVNSMFTQPFNNDASSFLLSDYNTMPFVTPSNGRGFGEVIPNYHLYALHWDNLEYEHLLPKSAPELISFNPNEDGGLLTHTNRKSKQFLYTEAPQRDNANPDKELALIPNQYSQPVSQVWSLSGHTILSEITDKPFFDIGEFSANGNRFASPVSAGGNQVNLWNTEDWTPAHELVLDSTGTVHSLQFSPNNEWLVSTQDSALVWNTASGERIARFRHTLGEIYHAGFSANSSKLLTAGKDGAVMEWEILTNTGDTLIQDVSPVIYAGYLNDDSILYVLEDGTANVFEKSSESVVLELGSNIGQNSFRSVTLSVDKRYLFIGNEVWDLSNGEKVTSFADNASPILDMERSGDGIWLATRHSDFTARVWKIQSLIQRQSAINVYDQY